MTFRPSNAPALMASKTSTFLESAKTAVAPMMTGTVSEKKVPIGAHQKRFKIFAAVTPTRTAESDVIQTAGRISNGCAAPRRGTDCCHRRRNQLNGCRIEDDKHAQIICRHAASRSLCHFSRRLDAKRRRRVSETQEVRGDVGSNRFHGGTIFLRSWKKTLQQREKNGFQTTRQTAPAHHLHHTRPKARHAQIARCQQSWTAVPAPSSAELLTALMFPLSIPKIMEKMIIIVHIHANAIWYLHCQISVSIYKNISSLEVNYDKKCQNFLTNSNRQRLTITVICGIVKPPIVV